MSTLVDTSVQTSKAKSLNELMLLIDDLGPVFAARASAIDETDSFVMANFNDLKKAGFTAAGVPRELGGLGLSHRELAELLRNLAKYCGSTALAISMHTHQVVVAAWRRHHQNMPLDALLRRVATEDLILLSSGGSDWLSGSGTATRTDGGYMINGTKVFTSGAPAGDLLMTSAVYSNPESGDEVLHFALPMQAKGVRILDTWRVLGMRGTGSHDVEIKDFFLADSAVSGRRPQGKWHPLFHIISMLAFPLIYAVYLGIAETARDRALARAKNRKSDTPLIHLIGEMDRELLKATLAHNHMMDIAATHKPGAETTNAVMAGRVLTGEAVIRCVEKALEVSGGAGFYRNQEIERLFRDIQAARFHPLQDKNQLNYAGRFALGLDLDETWI